PNTAGYTGLNGDILVWNPVLNCSFELSSMGIRGNKEALLKHLTLTNSLERRELDFHTMLLEDLLLDSIGGGIGQSRVCMFMLNKAHIGEVQVSVWDQSVRDSLSQQNIHLL